MIIFRPHRGHLDEAMAEAREFATELEMKVYIVDIWDGYFGIDDIVIYGESMCDERNGWEDTRYVCTNKFGDQDNIKEFGVPQCIGMCATKYKPTNM